MTQSTKVKVLVEYELEIPMTEKEANRAYPDCLWPQEALALDKISEMGIKNLITSETKTTVKDLTL